MASSKGCAREGGNARPTTQPASQMSDFFSISRDFPFHLRTEWILILASILYG